MSKFTEWLNQKLRAHGWSNSELARRAGISQATVSIVVNDQHTPSFDFCIGIAHAFGEPQEKVLRLAGLLDPLSPEVEQEDEVIRILRTMPQERRSTVVAMLQGLDGGGRRASPPHPVQAATHGRRTYRMRRPTALRDRALLLLLLDTGLRASECARLTVADLDPTTGAITVRSHNSGRKSKPRLTYLGNIARKALWRYLAARDTALHDPLFAAANGQPLRRDGIRFICRRLGERAEIKKPVYPHRLRHTFAINYLRNSGDVYTLQRLLGHSSLEMVRRYLSIAQSDLEAAHRRASPVDNWRL